MVVGRTRSLQRAGGVLALGTWVWICAWMGAPLAAQPAAETLGPEFLVNTFTTGDQDYPAVAMDSFGNFVVVWESEEQEAAGYGLGIFGQRFDSLGAPVGGEFPVNTFTTGDQSDPALALDEAGNVVVVWTSAGQDGNLDGVFAQRFDGAGAAAGAEFQVNTFVTDAQNNAAVAVDGSGDFVVAWESETQDGYGTGVFAQRFDSLGVARGSELPISNYVFNDQRYPAVGMTSEGDFVVAWDSGGVDGNGYGISHRRFDATGAPLSVESVVNTDTAGNQLIPTVGRAPSGEFVVTWTTTDAAGLGIAARRFDAAGVGQGPELAVNTYTPSAQAVSAVDMNASGEFLIAWRSTFQDGGSNGVFAQFFDASGAPLGMEFQVNTYTVTSQLGAAVGIDSAGNFVVAWRNTEEFTGYEDIFAQRFLAPCRETLSPVQDRWYLMALPCQPRSGEDTVRDVFGDDFPLLGYGASWTLLEWDPSTGLYGLVPLDDPVEMGKGYWFRTTLAGRSLDVEGHNADYSCDPSGSHADVGGCVETPPLTGSGGDCTDSDLSDGGFNLVGTPFRQQIQLAGALFDDDGTERSVPEAEGLNLAGDMAWTWNGSAYQAGDSCTMGMEKTFDTWDGFWIDVCDADASPLALRVPSRKLDFGCGPPDPPSGPEGEAARLETASRERLEPGGGPGRGGGGGKGQPPKDDSWYLRLVAAADGLVDPGNVLGELPDSVAARDGHDLLELRPFGGDWLTVVFPHPEWEADASEWYTSDYHGPKDAREWDFEVRSSEARSVTLTWELEGDPKLLRKMILVDTVSGEIVPAGAGSYSFTMRGTEHAFEWKEEQGGGGPPRGR